MFTERKLLRDTLYAFQGGFGREVYNMDSIWVFVVHPGIASRCLVYASLAEGSCKDPSSSLMPLNLLVARFIMLMIHPASADTSGNLPQLVIFPVRSLVVALASFGPFPLA